MFGEHVNCNTEESVNMNQRYLDSSICSNGMNRDGWMDEWMDGWMNE